MRISTAVYLAVLSTFPVQAALTVTLTPSAASPRPVGTSINWTATVSDTDAGAHVYRFLVNQTGEPLQVRQDYGEANTWKWTPIAHEGNFTVRVVVFNTTTGDFAFSDVPYQLTSRLVGGAAAVNSTNHPLVAFFSGPPCQKPNFMRVRFHKMSSPDSQMTDLLPCRVDPAATPQNTLSMNFLVAGMYASSTYLMRWETITPAGSVLNVGTEYPFTTRAIPASVPIPPMNVLIPPPPGDTEQPFILHSVVSVPRPNGTRYTNFVTDLAGNVVWYSPAAGVAIDRTRFGGNMMVLEGEHLHETDLAGNVVLDTNAHRVSSQLVARGMRPITGFHHDIRRINNPGFPNDNYIVVLGANEMISTSAQGGTPAAPVDIIGDVVIVLDKQLQVVWAWDAFDHLDVNRGAVLNEVCNHGGPGCEPFSNEFQFANDWLHANSIQFTPWDGNFIMSLRHQDWVIKINYGNGAGNGNVLWRMGPGGDFTITVNGTATTHDIGYPFFSHQHDPEFELQGMQFGGRRVMTVYDNGDTRQARFNPDAHSRCQSYAVDEAARTVNLNINGDVGQYSFALGSAQLLTNGNLHCNSGVVGTIANGYTLATEHTRQGTLAYTLKSDAVTYRSFRMTNLYSPVTP